MRNKVFAIIVAISLVFLALLWEQQRQHQKELALMHNHFVKLEKQMRLLKLKARALKTEVRMIEVSNHLQILKGWSSMKKKRHSADNLKGEKK